MTFKPLHFIAVALAGWMNRQQQEVKGQNRQRSHERQSCLLLLTHSPDLLLREAEKSENSLTRIELPT